MVRSQLYVCPICPATKQIYANSTQSTESFMQELPDKIFCGWRGCGGMMIKKEIK